MCFVLAELILRPSHIIDVGVRSLHYFSYFRNDLSERTSVVRMSDFDHFSATWVAIIERKANFVVFSLH